MSFNAVARTMLKPLLIFILATTLIIAGLGVVSTNRARASGTTITVNSLSDDQTAGTGACVQSGTICLRNAIATANAAANPTTINFSLSGTITVSSVLAINNMGQQTITIDGSGQTIDVDGGHTTSVFFVALNTFAVFNVLSITNGNGSFPYGGGGVTNTGGLLIHNSIISGNSASNGGGGVQNNGTLVINNSTISNNSTAYGGEGGGVSGGMTTIIDSVITHNSASLGGGVSGGNTSISNTTLSNNSAMYGGGLYSAGSTSISNSTFFANSATSSGGGVHEEYGVMTISNSTLYGNSANYSGGGIDNFSSLDMLSTIVAHNTVSGSGSDPDIDSTFHSLGHNLIGNGTGASGFVGSDQVGTTASPIDPMLGALANNGGSTQTMAILSGSPAIGTGDCTGNTTVNPPAPAVGIDQRGVARHAPCDIGAYESSFGNNPTATATSTPNGTATSTSTPPLTPSSTLTPTNTSTATATGTSTNTPIPSNTPTITTTFTPSNTATITRTSTATATSTPKLTPIDTIGVYRSGIFYLRLHNSTGNADLTIAFNPAGKAYPIVGDWTGAGFDTVGVFDQNNGKFSLCTASDTASCANVANQKTLVLGIPNDVPLSGRWVISATNAGVGVSRPSNGLIYLKNALTTGYADDTMVLGIPGDQGLAGDWNAKGFDSPGVYRPGNSTFYLSNQVTNGTVIGDYQFAYGISGDAPVTGDWIAQGHDGVGLFRQSNGLTYLKNQLVTGYADNTFTYGIAGDVPVAGHWQTVYPPIASAPVLIAKTAAPPPSNGSVEGSNPLGD